jgi:hypothetical protein
MTGDGVLVMAEIPGMDPASLNVSGQSHTLTIKGEREHETVGDAAVSSPVPTNFLMNSISTRRPPHTRLGC